MNTLNTTLVVILGIWGIIGLYGIENLYEKLEQIPKWHKKFIYVLLLGPFVVFISICLLVLFGLIYGIGWISDTLKIEDGWEFIKFKLNNWLYK